MTFHNWEIRAAKKIPNKNKSVTYYLNGSILLFSIVLKLCNVIIECNKKLMRNKIKKPLDIISKTYLWDNTNFRKKNYFWCSKKWGQIEP